MIVSPASRIDNAISFGVFWRFAPSTSAIIRSRNVSPGFAVIRTTISSDSTRVPPVTADRSPPDSRTTGADSPVIADSSTDAMPSITSPSDGITSPAATTHSSPTSSALDGTCSTVPSARRRFAIVSVRVLRSDAACALPRPSAIASAKFANNTVAQRKQRDEAGEHVLVRRRLREVPKEQHRRVDAADLDHEDHRVAEQRARVQLAEAVDDGRADDRAVEHALLAGCRRARSVLRAREVGLGLRGWLSPMTSQGEMLEDGTECQRREVRQAGDDQDDGDDEPAEQRRVRRQACPTSSAPSACGPAIRRWRARG